MQSLTLREADGTTWPLWPMLSPEADVAALAEMLNAEIERVSTASSVADVPSEMQALLQDAHQGTLRQS